MGWTLIILALVALALFGVWRWAVAYGSAGTLDWLDARFPREVAVERVATGSFGAAEAQSVELYRPVGGGSGDKPLVVFIHGGGWHLGAPTDYRFVARAMGDLGYPTALVGYRLVPDGRFPAMLEDSAAGLRWIIENAPRHDISTDRIVLMGHSAGAYNALMLGLDESWLEQQGLRAGSVDGVISLAGPADFYPFDTDSSRNAFGRAADPQATQPVNFARAGAPPVLLLHGDADTVVRPRNSRVLDQAIREAGGRSETAEFPGMSHAGLIMAFARPFDRDRAVLDRVDEFIRSIAAEPSVPVQGETG